MKKLMIALAAVAMAAGVQAAQVIWSAGTDLVDSKGTAVTSADILTGYVFDLTKAEYDTYAAMDGATLSKTIAGLWGTEDMPGTAAGSGKNTYAKRGGAALNVTGTPSFAAEETAYGLIVYTDAGNPDYYMANVAQQKFEGAADLTVSGLMTKLGGSAENRGATAWAQAGAVPEPTSGLLLLLGMAGLALRRRRA